MVKLCTADPHSAVMAASDSSAFVQNPEVCGIDLDAHPLETVDDYRALLSAMMTSGYQATHLGRAAEVMRAMYNWSLNDEPYDKEYEIINRDDDPKMLDPAHRATVRTKVFLGFTSNLISSGLREIFVYMAKHKLVDVIVSTAGGIEEDFIKCLGPSYVADFNLDGAALREAGMNRIGNLVLPNENYCAFEAWLMPILDAMKVEQDEQGVRWTPSKIINRLGKEINNENSLYYWCWKNDIHVYSPAITDGSIGDMLFFHRIQSQGGLVVDVVEDIWAMNREALDADGEERRTGAIILGGGVPKHHIFNANLMRNGLDFVTIVSTTQEFDGSDGGARIEEGISWGKVQANAKHCKVYCDATIAFPLLAATVLVPEVRRRAETQNK